MDQENDLILPTWLIAGTTGWVQLQCTARAKSGRAGIVVASLQLRGNSWERDRDLRSAKLTLDFDISLPQIVLALTELGSLADQLAAWEARKNDIRVEVSADSTDQHLSFSIGQNPALIYTDDKPACTIEFTSGPAISWTSSFVVDQSCVRICAESLREFVGRVSPS